MKRYISLDTCSWIYLANGTEPSKYLHKLIELNESGAIEIIVPSLVVEEWDRNKQNEGKLKNDVTQTTRLLKELENTVGSERVDGRISFIGDTTNSKSILTSLINSIADLQDDVDQPIKQNIETINDFFTSGAKIIDVDEDAHLKAAQFAIAKKAPFQERNSFADAAILFTILGYYKKEEIVSGAFVSANTKDFCEKQDKTTSLHSDLISEFEVNNTKYYKYIGELFRAIDTAIVTDEELRIRASYDDSEHHYCDLCTEAGYGARDIQLGSHMDIYDHRPNSSSETEPCYESYANSGCCDNCGTLHIKCIDCNFVIPISDWQYDDIIECEGCGLIYQVDYEYDPRNLDQIEIKVKEETVVCQKCSEEFKASEIVEDLCNSCEDKYGYE